MGKRRQRASAEGTFLESVLRRLQKLEYLISDLHWMAVGQPMLLGQAVPEQSGEVAAWARFPTLPESDVSCDGEASPTGRDCEKMCDASAEVDTVCEKTPMASADEAFALVFRECDTVLDQFSAGVEVWHALAGMNLCNMRAGATLISNDTEPDTDFEGESLVNLILAKRDTVDCTIRAVKQVYAQSQFSPPHTFSVGDVVYCGMTHAPFLVKRIGYGAYLSEVRIIRVGQKDTYAAGTWVHHSQLYLLEIGDTLKAVADVTDATHEANVIPRGSTCRFSGFDDEGDILICLDSQEDSDKNTVVFFEDLKNLTLI